MTTMCIFTFVYKPTAVTPHDEMSKKQLGPIWKAVSFVSTDENSQNKHGEM